MIQDHIFVLEAPRDQDPGLEDYTGNNPSLRVILPDLVDLGQTVRA